MTLVPIESRLWRSVASTHVAPIQICVFFNCVTIFVNSAAFRHVAPMQNCVEFTLVPMELTVVMEAVSTHVAPIQSCELFNCVMMFVKSDS